MQHTLTHTKVIMGEVWQHEAHLVTITGSIDQPHHMVLAPETEQNARVQQRVGWRTQLAP